MEQDNRSAVEKIKEASDGLRGTIAEGVLNDVTGAMAEDDQQLMKFHGMYQQDDRDRREERAAKKLERLYSFMIRLRLPGGFMTSEQWLATHQIAGKFATETIKITTRQTLQLHGIVKSKIRPTLQAFNTVQLDSIATCGDIHRNIACSSHPKESPLHATVFNYAASISKMLLPKTNAYYEIWIDDEKLAEKNDESDPLYENRYLPRKFKIGIAIPPNNDVDVLTNDIGLIAIIENNELAGFNIAIGGGLSSTHGNPEHYPRLATLIGFSSSEEQTLKTIYEILTVQRDWGNRADRKRARLKYTLDVHGVEAFKNEVEKRTGMPLAPVKEFRFKSRTDHPGWIRNSEGLWYYTLIIENGRVADETYKIKTCLYEIAQKHVSNFRFTSNQNLIISEVKEEDKPIVQRLLDQYNLVEYQDKMSSLRRNSMACVALNTCPLALAEGQRYLPSLISSIEPIMAKHGLSDERIILRMTGCPNGCARSANAEIGLIGTAPGHYNLHLGGDHEGYRLNRLYKESLNEQEILNELDHLFANFAAERKANESFGDFTFRKLYN